VIPGRLAARLASTLAAAAMVAACGGSSSSSSTTASSSAAGGSATTAAAGSATSSAAATGSGAATTTSGTSTAGESGTSAGTTATATATGTATGPAASAAALASCRSGTTTVSVGRGSGGLGHLAITLLFHNGSGSRCVLFGYPGVALASASGTQVQAARTRSGYLGGLSSSATAVPVVRLGPGQTASALMEGDDVASGGGTCPGYASLLVTPPNETSTQHLARSLTALCSPQIHPVVAGATGSQR
jgi:hypothetical protein